MSARVVTGLLALFLVALSHAAAQDKKAHKLEGTWVRAGVERYGKFVEARKDERSTLNIDKGKFKLVNAVLTREGPYTVDDARSPRHLDLTWTFRGKEQHLKALYEIKGDTLRIAWPSDGPGAPRPTEMRSNVQADIVVFKRKK